MVLSYAVVPVFLNTADEGFEDLAEIHVRVHSFGDVAVEHRTLVLPERLVVFLVGQEDQILAESLFALLDIEEFPA